MLCSGLKKQRVFLGDRVSAGGGRKVAVTFMTKLLWIEFKRV